MHACIPDMCIPVYNCTHHIFIMFNREGLTQWEIDFACITDDLALFGSIATVSFGTDLFFKNSSYTVLPYGEQSNLWKQSWLCLFLHVVQYLVVNFNGSEHLSRTYLFPFILEQPFAVCGVFTEVQLLYMVCTEACSLLQTCRCIFPNLKAIVAKTMIFSSCLFANEPPNQPINLWVEKSIIII